MASLPNLDCAAPRSHHSVPRVSFLTCSAESIKSFNDSMTKINTLINNLTYYLSTLEEGTKQLSDGTSALKDGVAVLVTTLFVALYMLLGTRINHNDFWIRGEWWWNCVHLFPIGMLFAKFEDKIVPHLKKYYWVYLIIAVAAVYPLYLYSRHLCDVFGYYGENWGAPDVVLRRRISLLGEMLVTTDFVFAFLLLGMKVKIGNKFLKFMGTITLEFYLIHGLFVELFGWQFDGGVKSPHHIKYVIVYVLAVYALGVPSALLLKKLHGLILGLSKKKNKSDNKPAKCA